MLADMLYCYSNSRRRKKKQVISLFEYIKVNYIDFRLKIDCQSGEVEIQDGGCLKY